MKKIILILIFSLSLFSFAFPIQAQDKIFTPEELSQYDGKDDHKAYYAFEGKVYDVTSSPLFKLGEHFGHHAGEDLTGKLEEAPHGIEVFAPFKIVGEFKAADSENLNPEPAAANQFESKNKSKWYEGRIRILGISILGWTGIIMGIFFVLTFATCFAMPWAKLPLPWKGTRIGPDPMDAVGKRMPFTFVHKHFVWWTVILGIIHGVLGILQLLGIYL